MDEREATEEEAPFSPSRSVKDWDWLGNPPPSPPSFPSTAIVSAARWTLQTAWLHDAKRKKKLPLPATWFISVADTFPGIEKPFKKWQI